MVSNIKNSIPDTDTHTNQPNPSSDSLPMRPDAYDALQHACAHGHLDKVKLLLNDKQIDPSAQDNFAVVLACENGYADVVRVMLADERVDPSAQQNEAIKLTCMNGHANVLQLLLADARADPATMVDEPIKMASKHGHSDITQLLLTDTRVLVDPRIHGSIAMCLASENGHADVVELLMANGRISPLSISRYSAAPLDVASKNGHVNVVQLLLTDSRVDPMADFRAVRPLESACVGGHIDIVNVLLADQRVDPVAIFNIPLKCACKGGHLDVLKVLLADSRVGTADGLKFALAHACYYGRMDFIKYLMEKRHVNPSEVERIWVQAITGGQVDVVKFLLADGRADPSEEHNRPLRSAAGHGNVDIFKLLIADKRVCPDEYTMRDVLSDGRGSAKHIEVVKLLLQDGRFDPSENEYTYLKYAIEMTMPGMVKTMFADRRLQPHKVLITTQLIAYLDGDSRWAFHDPELNVLTIEVLFTVRPEVVSELFVKNMACTERGPLREALARWERKAVWLLLLCVKRARLQARVSDVLRHVVKEWISQVGILPVPQGPRSLMDGYKHWQQIC